VSADYWLGAIHFVPLDGSGPKIFGFSEFLAGLALMVLAWTIGDVRYRFRVRTAPIPLYAVTFWVVAAVGVLTLLTDLWRAQEWLVPEGDIVTPAAWQAILAGTFLLTFLAWAWYAFMRPPVYGRINARRFARALYVAILKGSPSELEVIAGELAYSAKPLIRYASERERFRPPEGGQDAAAPPSVTRFANDILLLIAEKRFCRAVVTSSPVTALALFQEVAEAKKYGVQVRTFARNLVSEAFANRDSFLFHEGEGYESGLLGYHRPLSQAMFSNYNMVETVGSLLAPDFRALRGWDSSQWEAYCRIVLMTLRDYVEKEYWEHSTALYGAKDNIEQAVSDLHKLNGVASVKWDDDVLDRLRVVVEFIEDAIETLDKKKVPDHLVKRVRDRHRQRASFYDHLADLIFEVITHASRVTSPWLLCWHIQHNSLWNKLFNFGRLDSPAGKIVKFKVRRLLYDEVADMEKTSPNFLGASILGFCLNVMGFPLSEEDHDRDSRPLQKAILSWTRKNFAWLHAYNPRVAEACLVDRITFDTENLRLVKTYPVEDLRREASYVYFNVAPPRATTPEPPPP